MQSGKLIARALRPNLDAAVMIVADPTGDAEDVRFALDEPAEADALNPAANDVAAGVDRFFSLGHALNAMAS